MRAAAAKIHSNSVISSKQMDMPLGFVPNGMQQEPGPPRVGMGVGKVGGGAVGPPGVGGGVGDCAVGDGVTQSAMVPSSCERHAHAQSSSAEHVVELASPPHVPAMQGPKLPHLLPPPSSNGPPKGHGSCAGQLAGGMTHAARSSGAPSNGAH